MNSSRPLNTSPSVSLDGTIKKLKINIIWVIVFSFFINSLLFVGPLYMLQVYDRVLTSRSEMTLLMITLIAVMMLLVYAALEAVRSRVLVRTGARFDQLLARQLFHIAFRSHINRSTDNPGQLLKDLDSLREFLSGGAIIAMCDAPWVPIFLLICFILHPLLGFVALFGAIAIFVLALMNELTTRRNLNEAGSATRAANHYISSTLRNAETVHALGMMGAVLHRWMDVHARALGYQAKASDRAGAILAMSKFTRMVLQVAILGVGAYLVLEIEVTPGVMVATSIMMGRALSPVEALVGQWKSLINTRGAYHRVKQILETAPGLDVSMSLPAPQGRVTFEQVSVAPPGGRAPTLRGVSLDIQPGEAVGIIGPSGAGKSTLARAVVGVWPTISGQVRIDGSDVRTWNPDELGRHLGYLPQDVELFAGTVAENIARLGKVDSEMVVRAAQEAGVHDVILKLPEGYNTLLGENGIGLSGGQRQRIALARALYGDPRIIVLDEPNASLDHEGEMALTDAIGRMRDRGRTVIVVSHRTTLLSAIEKLAVFAGGTLTLYGPKDAVLNHMNKSPVSLTQARGQISPLKPA
ncbi:type I secretion system permease/ATPase [Terrihabitans sp. B22-R8]|uniref:type I secretion system permease/ATPase n=1 Tax=Terrihabitans sp. B22-R8 TaxID=3425128 RepID=UPI00403C82F6